MEFRDYLNNHIRMTTKFKTAEELLEKGNPLNFIWVCVGVVALIVILVGIVNDSLDVLTFAVLVPFFGYATAYLTGRVKYLSVWKKHCTGKLDRKIDLEDLIAFLNANLHVFGTNAGGWGFCGQDASGHETIGFKFTRHTNAIITFSDNGYTISARKGNVEYYLVITKHGLSAGKTDAGFGRLVCLCKTAPIIAAAVAYYIQSTNA